jgi:hypothetical protein
MYPLQYMMEEDRMRFTRIRAPQKDDICIFDFPIRARSATCTKDRRQTGDAWCVSGPVTTVDIVTAHHDTGELLRHEVRFIARF